MKTVKAISAAMVVAAMAGSMVLAADTYVGTGSFLNVGDSTKTAGGATADTARVDARAGASVLVTSKTSAEDDPYGAGKHAENLKGDYDVARVVVHNTRSDFGLDTYASKTGTAIGAYAKSNGVQSAALGYKAEVTRAAENGLALGYSSQAAAKNSVALGSGSVADEANTVSVGSSSSQRRIVNVADGTAATDAATVGQVQSLTGANTALIQNNSDSINRLDRSVSNLGTEIDHVGALSSALAGLHPLYTDQGFELSAAGGFYDGKQAVALGGFYHANPDVMLSFGAATSFGGNHKYAENVGVTFRVGSKTEKTAAVETGTSDDVMKRLDALSRKVDQLEAENKELKAKMNGVK
ncbi:YadA-like family protein [uncultured Megasphaera sp.]|uniref:YadA-like family protein n=1 Tax=uncultured Megasphaera sp. TaxID=165188 RepID=UPI0025E1AC5F|nr:YadA-like family protein [uncultured Megasphaera sp.]